MDRPLLKVLADNPALLAEVKAMLLDEFWVEDNRIDDQVSDERLGQMLRARIMGVRKIEEAFRKIAKYRSGGDVSVRVNEGR